MIASYRPPAVICMTGGGFLLIIAAALPLIFSSAPPLVFQIRAIVFASALVLFTIGCCLYAKGNGYPALLGLFGITVIGLLMLMLLPDRFPESDDD